MFLFIINLLCEINSVILQKTIVYNYLIEDLTIELLLIVEWPKYGLMFIV